MSLEPELFIKDFIAQKVATPGKQTAYRRPLVGFANADDPAWMQLRVVAEPEHYLPRDLLPAARSVIAFFIPFTDAVVQANRASSQVAREWAVAYRETNELINDILGALAGELEGRGWRAASEPSTHNFDPVTLRCRWSHKSAAAIAGLGSFGLHRMLITDMGCAGRCGSLVTDAVLMPTGRLQPERCLFFHDESCTYCVDACPPEALEALAAGEMNLDKHACNDYILDVAERLGTDCCGKCAMGPCALASAVTSEPPGPAAWRL